MIYLNSLQNLITMENISLSQNNKPNAGICNVCGKDFGNFQSMRQHQGLQHFKLLKQYRSQYGKMFELFVRSI